MAEVTNGKKIVIEGKKETLFLELIEEYQVAKKGGGKEAWDDRKEKWDLLREAFEAATGIEATVDQLKTKWNNVRKRALDKKKYEKGTGGGPQKPLSGNDELAIRILGGEENPTVGKVPGGMTGAGSSPIGVDESERGIRIPEKRNPHPHISSAGSPSPSVSSQCSSCGGAGVKRALTEYEEQMLEMAREEHTWKIRKLQLEVEELKLRAQGRVTDGQFCQSNSSQSRHAYEGYQFPRQVPEDQWREQENSAQKFLADFNPAMFERATLMNLIHDLGPYLEHETDRGRPLPVPLQVCLTLRYLATGQFQLSEASWLGIDQGTARMLFAFPRSSRRSSQISKRKAQPVFLGTPTASLTWSAPGAAKSGFCFRRRVSARFGSLSIPQIGIQATKDRTGGFSHGATTE
ncbi:unnamed protein product, partial [Cyprideis torosa]